jgi:thiamine-phosphate pyrophosphorylase
MSNNKLKPRCQLYLITPPKIEITSFKYDLAAALDAGNVACVQLRLKNISRDDILRTAEILAPLVQERDVAFIVNDDPKLAKESGCDGVHIGQEDTTYNEAREALGPSAIVGVTCHDQRHLAIEAAEKGADYVAFGAFFSTITKETKFHPHHDILTTWSTMTTVPCVAIGGITQENCPPLIQAGADFLAVVSAIWDYGPGSAAAVKAFNEVIAENS